MSKLSLFPLPNFKKFLRISSESSKFKCQLFLKKIYVFFCMRLLLYTYNLLLSLKKGRGYTYILNIPPHFEIYSIYFDDVFRKDSLTIPQQKTIFWLNNLTVTSIYGLYP